MSKEKKIGTLITYNLNTSKFSAAEITRFRRELYGWRDYSNGGRYQYDRPGILTKIPYMNPDQSVIIILKENAKIVMDHFKKYKVEVFSRDVILKEGDLTIPSSNK